MKTKRAKTCAYCGEVTENPTKDHVFNRLLFAVEQRGNLPVIHACEACNNAKASLERYLTTLLPFGGQMPNSLDILNSSKQQRRLENDRRLARSLREGLTGTIWEGPDGFLDRTVALPFEGEKLQALLRYQCRGLYAFHFSRILPPSTLLTTAFWRKDVDCALVEVLRRNAFRKITSNLGESTVVYEGFMSNSDENCSIWRIKLLGGVVLGSGEGLDMRADTCWVFSSDSPFFREELVWRDGV